MKEKVDVSFTFNDTNYHGAYKEHLKHRRKVWIIVRSILCVLMVMFGAYLTIVNSQPLEGGVPAFFGPLFITAGSVGFLRPMIWQMWHERNVRKHSAYGTKLRYVFSENGVKIIGKQGDFQLAWDELYECVLRKKGVLIYPQKKQFLWIPKRSFNSDQWSLMRNFVKVR